MRLTPRRRRPPRQVKTWMSAVAVAASVALAGPAFAQQQTKLNVFWVKGFYKAEDDALFEAIKKFEPATRTSRSS